MNWKSTIRNEKEEPTSSWKDSIREEKSMLESGVRGAAQGASLGFADEITGAAEALYNKALNGSKEDFAELYRKHRDESRQEYDLARKDNPLTYGASEIGGGVATAFLPGVGLAGNSLKGAAAIGAAGGLGNSRADLTEGELGQAALDAGLGAGAGAVGYGVGKGIGKAAEYWDESVAPSMQAKAREKAFESLNPTMSQALKAEAASGGASIDNIGKEMLDNEILKGKFGLPASISRIKDNLEVRTNELGEKIGNQLQDAQNVFPELRVHSSEVADAIRAKVEPLKQTPFWRGADAVGKEADVIASWDKQYTLPELNQLKTSIGDRIRTWGSNDLSDKKVYEEMYGAVNELIESELKKRAGVAAIAPEGRNLTQSTLDDMIANQENLSVGDQYRYERPLKDFQKTKGSYGSLENAQKISERAVARANSNNDFGLTSYIAGGYAGHLGIGGIPGIAAGIAGREALKRYGNQSTALILNKLSQTKFGPVLQDAMQRGGEAAVRSTLFVLANQHPEVRELLKEEDR